MFIDLIIQLRNFLILEALRRHGRNVAPNLSHHTGKTRKNINTRLPVLADYGLVEKVGPTEQSGLYQLTDKGRIVLELRAEYGEDDDFDALVENRLA